MTQVIFKWEDGTTRVVTYPELVRGLVHEGLRPAELEVVDSVCDVRVVEWINECYFALARCK